MFIFDFFGFFAVVDEEGKYYPLAEHFTNQLFGHVHAVRIQIWESLIKQRYFLGQEVKIGTSSEHLWCGFGANKYQYWALIDSCKGNIPKNFPFFRNEDKRFTVGFHPEVVRLAKTFKV